jgi:hypothetical protein
MRMEDGIDIDADIQRSINQNGYMARVLQQAIATGKSVPFDSASWSDTGMRRYDAPPWTWDGLSVGRWAGHAQGALSADANGHWTVDGTIEPTKPLPYSFEPDATGNAIQRAAGNAMIEGLGHFLNVAPRRNKVGTPMPLDFNRVYRFNSTGLYRKR